MKKAGLLLFTFLPVVVLLFVLSGLNASAALAAAGQPSASLPFAWLGQDGPEDPVPPVSQLLGDAPLLPEPAALKNNPTWTSPWSDKVNSMAWGDYDMDGDLDLATGSYGHNRIMTNIGGTITQTAELTCEPGLPENTYSVSWGDPDRDGDLDLAIGNFDGLNCVYIYDRPSGTFSRLWRATVAQKTMAVAWAGWQGSSFVTVMAVGNMSEPNAVYLYEGGILSPWWIETQNQHGSTRDLAWGDYDLDGDPDLAVANYGSSNVLYRNDRTGMTRIYETPHSYFSTSVAWGDMNNDGYLDLAFGNTRESGTTHPDQVYCNLGPDGGFSFQLCWTSSDLSTTTDVAWGDYDSDGDLDLAAAAGPNAKTRIYMNDGTTLNVNSGWSANDDAADSRVVSWADWDRDGDLEFAIGYYNTPSVIYQNEVGMLSDIPITEVGLDTRSSAWGDYDNDGDLDLVLGITGGQASRLYANDGQGNLTRVWDSPFLDSTRSVAWGDFDGDNDLDLAVGNGEESGYKHSRIYENVDGVLQPYSLIPRNEGIPGNTYSVAWGDFDGDLDLDLAVGNYESWQDSYIYINEYGVFSKARVIGVKTDRTFSLAWGDFDQDYDLDLAVGNKGGPSRVLVNQGGSFTSITLPLPQGNCPTDARSVAWGDWDADGDLDLAIGNGGDTGCVQILAAQNSGGAWNFTSAWQSTETHLDTRGVAWADADGDGDLDLAAAITSQFGSRSRLFQNRGGSMEVVWMAPVEDDGYSYSVAWGDVDNDGDQDLALTNAASPAKPNRLYFNSWTNSNNLPNDPITVNILRPDQTSVASFFSASDVVGNYIIPIYYLLQDNESDRAFQVEVQVSWDGGGKWEPAWEPEWVPDPECGYYGESIRLYHSKNGMRYCNPGTWDKPASANGSVNYFVWDAMNQLLDHQGIPFDPENGVYVPFDQSWEEMDVALRVVAWSNPEHGGLIQRPNFGAATTMFRVDMRPDFTFSSKSAPAYVHPGEHLPYTITINQIDQGMPPGFITDLLPRGLYMDLYDQPNPTSNQGYPTTFLSSFNLLAPNLITWTGGIDYEDPLLEIYFSPKVTLPLTNGLKLENCAQVFDGLHVPFDICHTVEISSTPILTTSFKLVNGEIENYAEPGDVLTYTMLLENLGTDNARGAKLTDKLDPKLVWLNKASATSGTTSFANGVFSWTGDINVSRPVTVTFLAQVAAPLPGNSIITNTFTLDDHVNPLYTAPHVTTYVYGPDLSESYKTVVPTDTVQLGDVVTYTLTLVNTGSRPAEKATVKDPIPAGGDYVAGTATATAGKVIYNAGTDSIDWSGVIPVEEQVEITYQVRVAAPVGPTPHLINTAVLQDPQAGQVTMQVTNLMWLPNMSGSTKTAVPAQVEIGDTLTFTLVIKNSGGNAPAVKVTDPLPFGSTYVPNSFSATSGLGGLNNQGQVEWNGSMVPGEVVTMTFAIVVGAPETNTGKLVNVATVTEPGSGTYPLRSETKLNLPNLFSSTKSVNAENIQLGEVVTYTIQVNNEGGYGPNLSMEDPLQGLGTYLVGSFYASSGVGSYQAASDRITWQGDLNTNESATIRFAVETGCPVLPADPKLTNEATVRNSVGVTTTVSATSNVIMPDLSSSTFDVSQASAKKGERVTYTLTLRNTGGRAPYMSVSDDLPVGLVWLNEYSAPEGVLNYDYAARRLTWSGAMQSDSVVTIRFTVELSENASLSPTLFNSVVIWDSCRQSNILNTALVVIADEYYLHFPLINRREQ